MSKPSPGICALLAKGLSISQPARFQIESATRMRSQHFPQCIQLVLSSAIPRICLVQAQHGSSVSGSRWRSSTRFSETFLGIWPRGIAPFSSCSRFVIIRTGVRHNNRYFLYILYDVLCYAVLRNSHNPVDASFVFPLAFSSGNLAAHSSLD